MLVGVMHTLTRPLTQAIACGSVGQCSAIFVRTGVIYMYIIEMPNYRWHLRTRRPLVMPANRYRNIAGCELVGRPNEWVRCRKSHDYYARIMSRYITYISWILVVINGNCHSNTSTTYTKTYCSHADTCRHLQITMPKISFYYRTPGPIKPAFCARTLAILRPIDERTGIQERIGRF